MKRSIDSSGLKIVEQHGLTLSQRTLSLLKIVEAMPGCVAKPMPPPRATVPNVILYKVMDKIFAIVAIRLFEGVILKCDPQQAIFLRDQYEGVGHRSHLDSRYWISVKLDADVPELAIEKLVIHSYEQVCATLTKKQQAKLLSLSN